VENLKWKVESGEWKRKMENGKWGAAIFTCLFKPISPSSDNFIISKTGKPMDLIEVVDLQVPASAALLLFRRCCRHGKPKLWGPQFVGDADRNCQYHSVAGIWHRQGRFAGDHCQYHHLYPVAVAGIDPF
jgi:hypothetical protein